MANIIKTLEQGRAKFAYKCAEQMLTLKDFLFTNPLKKVEKTYNFVLPIFEDYKLKLLRNPKYSREVKNIEDVYNAYISSPSPFDKNTTNEINAMFIKFHSKMLKDYKSYAKKIPMLIKTNGLGATIAFVFSKGSDNISYRIIYNQITEWMKIEAKQVIAEELEKNSLVKEVTEISTEKYRLLQTEILAFLSWLRRFAEGMIEGEAEE